MESALKLIFVISIAVWCYKEGKWIGSRSGCRARGRRANRFTSERRTQCKET